ncbi:MAG: replicative DNA helicase [Bdellovibrionota bacterium]
MADLLHLTPQDGPAPAGRKLPQDLDAEECVLGALLLDGTALDKIPFLKDTDFYREGHRRIFRAAKHLAEKNEPVDVVTVAGELKKRRELEAVGGEILLAHLVSYVPTAANVRHYAERVREAAGLRDLITLSAQVTEAAFEPGASPEAIHEWADAESLRQRRVSWKSLSPAAEVTREAWSEIERCQSRGDYPGIPTKIPSLDQATGGLGDGDLVLLCARPAVGKTALLLRIARAAAGAGFPCAIFSLEMPKTQLMLRLFAAESQINFSRLKRGAFLGEDEQEKLAHASATIAGLPLLLDDQPGQGLAHIRAKCRQLARKYPDKRGLVAIDYVQLLAHGNDTRRSRYEETSYLSRELKLLAKELNWPVLALTQLNRELEKRTDSRPRLSDIRDSGAFEQDADLVLLLHRAQPQLPDGEGELIIAKNRNGPCTLIPLAFRLAVQMVGERAG